MTEVAVVRDQGNALAMLLSDTEKLKEFPIETVERLFALDREYRADRARADFHVAFNTVQSQLAPVRKTGRNTETGSMYAKSDAVMAMLDPIITANGFSRSISTEDCPTPGYTRFVLMLRHIGGHEERHRLDAPIDNVGPKGTANKTVIHGMMSSYTLCERHLCVKVFGLQIVDDDDGNAAGGIGPGTELITPKQATQLNALADEVGADKGLFCKMMNIGSIPELSASQFKVAVVALRAKGENK